MQRPWTIVYREGDFVASQPADNREAALDTARLMTEQGRAVLAIRSGEKVLDVVEIEHLIGPLVRN
jgi:hypothetical protein